MLWYISNHSISSKSYLSHLTTRIVIFSCSHAYLALSLFDKKQTILLIRIILSKIANTFERHFCATFENEFHSNDQRATTCMFLPFQIKIFFSSSKVSMNTMEIVIWKKRERKININFLVFKLVNSSQYDTFWGRLLILSKMAWIWSSGIIETTGYKYPSSSANTSIFFKP